MDKVSCASACQAKSLEKLADNCSTMSLISILDTFLIISSRKFLNLLYKFVSSFLLCFTFYRVYPELVEAYAMNPITKGPFFSTETITSRDGVEFTSFAKTRKFEKELYADLVVPFFGGGDYYAETWRHGGGNLPSNCSRTSKIFNVKSISIRGKGIGFETMKDHSKWLVGRNRDVVCVGDINRQVSNFYEYGKFFYSKFFAF